MSTSRRRAHLDGGFRHGGEHATRNAGEQLDAVQRGDALDETERGSQPSPIFASISVISCTS